jgi:hypothetical protein
VSSSIFFCLSRTGFLGWFVFALYSVVTSLQQSLNYIFLIGLMKVLCQCSFCSEVGNENQVSEMVHSIAKEARITCNPLPPMVQCMSLNCDTKNLLFWADSISGTQKFEISSDQVWHPILLLIVG